MRNSKFKKLLVGIYEKLFDLRRTLYRDTRYAVFVHKDRLRIMSAAETVRFIEKHKCSIARFGDGEFDLIRGCRNLKFQRSSPELAEALIEVLDSKDSNLLLCIPGVFNSIRGSNWHAAMFWSRWAIDEEKHHPTIDLIREHHKTKYLFGDAQITRPYIDWTSSKRAKKIFPMLKQLWNGKDILIVEGEKTRLGVGNDLFSNANSVKRILGPATDAFFYYKDIMRAVLDRHSNELVILALGPTATILASKLSANGIQALDLGHIDVEYEWFLSGAKQKQLIPGKFLNEVVGGENPCDCLDERYLEQIIARIGC
ncbi:MAG: GT-D fold domain-containing glycosyltransferase [Clostridiales bacterium]|nr:GT-D fold domain-containing glycosyltransferase [Clostridiales bacterium]